MNEAYRPTRGIDPGDERERDRLGDERERDDEAGEQLDAEHAERRQGETDGQRRSFGGARGERRAECIGTALTLGERVAVAALTVAQGPGQLAADVERRAADELHARAIPIKKHTTTSTQTPRSAPTSASNSRPTTATVAAAPPAPTPGMSANSEATRNATVPGSPIQRSNASGSHGRPPNSATSSIGFGSPSRGISIREQRRHGDRRTEHDDPAPRRTIPSRAAAVTSTERAAIGSGRPPSAAGADDRHPLRGPTAKAGPRNHPCTRTTSSGGPNPSPFTAASLMRLTPGSRSAHARAPLASGNRSELTSRSSVSVTGGPSTPAALRTRASTRRVKLFVQPITIAPSASTVTHRLTMSRDRFSSHGRPNPAPAFGTPPTPESRRACRAGSRRRSRHRGRWRPRSPRRDRD